MARFSLAELLSYAAGLAVACAVVASEETIPNWLIASGILFILGSQRLKADSHGYAISLVAIGWLVCSFCSVNSMLDCFQVSNSSGHFRSRYARSCFFDEFSLRFGFALVMSAPTFLSMRSIVANCPLGLRLVLASIFLCILDTALLVSILEYLVSFDW